jgi:hypothetical protein
LSTPPLHPADDLPAGTPDAVPEEQHDDDEDRPEDDPATT